MKFAGESGLGTLRLLTNALSTRFLCIDCIDLYAPNDRFARAARDQRSGFLFLGIFGLRDAIARTIVGLIVVNKFNSEGLIVVRFYR